jgi:hypothetical protein
MSSRLDRLCGAQGPLAKEAANEDEIAGLLRSAQARLADAGNRALSVDSRFDLAYGAAHALSAAALRRLGYRAKQRYIVFQVLDETLEVGPEIWRVLARCHELRNLAEYEGELRASPELVEEVIAICRKLAAQLNRHR